MFDNLATLADVMLASAGQLEDKSLKRKIDLARAKISQTILPITPEMSSKRTMQVIWGLITGKSWFMEVLSF